MRIVYTSHMGVGASSAFVPMVDHAATEAALEASGVPFTALRNGFYTASGVRGARPRQHRRGRSEVTGREVTRVTVSDDEYPAGMVAHGVPEAQADRLLGVFAAGRRGEFAAVDPTLEHLLGRTPTFVRDVIAAQSDG